MDIQVVSTSALADLFQIKGRNGWYLRVSVSSHLGALMKTPAVVRKAGRTHQEAVRNKPRLAVDIQKYIQIKTGDGPIEKKLRNVQPSDHRFQEELKHHLKEAGVRKTKES